MPDQPIPVPPAAPGGAVPATPPVSDGPADPAELDGALRATGYLPDAGLATVAWLALRLRRPLFLEGEPGTGKTSLAEALAEATGAELIRLQCYEGIDAAQALYDWDYPRQLLHLRALEAGAAASSGSAPGSAAGPAAPGSADAGREDWERSVYDERFLLQRPVLRALRAPRAVLLVDEIDRADDEFEAFLLEVLSTYAVSIPELGTVRAQRPPLVVLTSNRTREVHDALKRRCLYHWVRHPDLEREVEIVRERAPDVPAALARQVAAAVQELRSGDAGVLGIRLVKPPGVAETLDWARALQALGAPGLDVAAAAATLGAVCKVREDDARVRSALDRLLERVGAGVSPHGREEGV